MMHGNEEAPQDTAQVDRASTNSQVMNSGPALGGPTGSSTDGADRQQPVGGTPPAEVEPSRLTARDRKLIKAKATRESKISLGVIKDRCKTRWREAVGTSGTVASTHSGTLGHYVVAPSHPWASIHASHVMLVSGGLAFCKRCGKTSSTGGSLDEVCFVGCKTPNATRVCRNLLKGVMTDPRSYPFWPNGDISSLKNRPVTLKVTISTGNDTGQVVTSTTSSRSASPTPSSDSTPPAGTPTRDAQASHSHTIADDGMPTWDEMFSPIDDLEDLRECVELNAKGI
jgi:hypothetical protein